MADLMQEVDVQDIQQQEVYVGPRPFERKERNLFFGRDREISELLSLVTSSRVVLCYAPSGAGKTSLINAGLQPRLEQEDFEILPSTRVRGLIPEGIDPAKIGNIYVFHALLSLTGEKRQATELVACTMAEFLATLPHIDDEDGFPKPRILIFDQFEELITSYPERWHEREAFFHQVHDALQTDTLLRIVFVMREDFLARIEPFTRVLKPFAQSRFRLDLLGKDGARAAVIGPLQGTGRRFKEGVVDTLVEELLKVRVETTQGSATTVVGEYVEPVQLQVVCRNLWTSLPPDVQEISESHLKAYGDVDHALRDFYEDCIGEAKSKLGANELNLRQWFEQQLITPAGTRGIVFQDAKQTAGLPNPVVELLENQHLIRGEWRAGSRWYELTHDRFIDPIQRANEQWRTRRQARRNKLVTTVAFTLLVIVLAASLFNIKQAPSQPQNVSTAVAATVGVQANAQATAQVQVQQAAQEDVALAKSRQLAAQALAVNDQRLALLLDVEANNSQDTLEARRSLHRVLSRQAVIDGKFLRGLDPGFTSPTLSKRLDAHKNWVESVAFSPDGSQFVSGSADGTIIRWDAVTAKPLGAALSAKNSTAMSVAISPDNKLIAVATLNEQVLLFDALTGKPFGNPLAGHVGMVTSVAFSPDGKWLASGGEDRTVQFWDMSSGQLQLKKTVLEPAAVWSLAWSPDSKTLAAGSAGRWLRLWDTDTFGEPRVLKGANALVRSIAWSPDGRILAAGIASLEGEPAFGEAIVWDTTSLEIVARPLPDNTQPVRAVAFHPNGGILAIGRDNGTILLWDTRSRQPLGEPFQAHNHRVMSIAFSPDGRYMLSGSIDKTVALWNLTASTQSIAVSPNGNLLATSQGAVISLWNLQQDQKLPVSVLSGHTDNVLALAFTPDGSMLASAGRDNTIRMWDVASGKQLNSPLQAGGVLTLDFSPDGKILAAGYEDGSVLLWDLVSHEAGHGFAGGHGPILKVLFREGGSVLEAASQDGSLFRWDLTSNPPQINPLPGSPGSFTSIAFSQGSQRVASFQGTTSLRNDNQRAHGIELSAWDESFDPTVNPDDIDFVVVTASQAEFKDPKFDEFLQPIQAIPIRGAMHIFAPGIPWKQQADYFLSIVKDKGFHFFVLDLQRLPEDGSTNFLADAEKWLKYVDDNTEQKILLETTSRFMNLQLGDLADWMKGWPLVLIDYPTEPDRNGTPVLPQRAQDWKMWQYTNQGNGAEYGVGTNSVDLEVFNGSPLDMAEWLGMAVFTISDVQSPDKAIHPSRTIQVTSPGGIAFSPNGAYIAVAGANEVALLNAETGEEISNLSYAGGTSLSLGFTPDSNKLAIGTQDGRVLVWDLSLLQEGSDSKPSLEIACSLAGANFSDAEWQQFFPNEDYRETCPGLPKFSPIIPVT